MHRRVRHALRTDRSARWRECRRPRPRSPRVRRPPVPALRNRFRSIALDHPGFRPSTAAPGNRYSPEEHSAVVVAFLDLLGQSGITLVAHDRGGPIGLAAAGQRPVPFSHLVLANTWAWPLNGTPTAKIASRVAGGPIETSPPHDGDRARSRPFRAVRCRRGDGAAITNWWSA
ncbi:alpha/beta fold hydrolase [Nocardia sp. NPDC052254]|uniref:alpha/beta fold hydrolase n=1 Tax=Nocardia sp. NPDC052254 TaxID=3155681 RepID=UPI0034227BC0